MDSDSKPFKKGTLYTIVGKRNGLGEEITFLAKFVRQDSGLYIAIEPEPGNVFLQYLIDIKCIKQATFLDKIGVYINLQLSIKRSNK